MKQRRLNALLLVGMIGIFTTGSILAVQIYRAFGANQDIWWTAKTMALKIEEARDSFEIFINPDSIPRTMSGLDFISFNPTVGEKEKI